MRTASSHGRVPAAAERLAREREVAHVGLGRDRRLVVPVALARTARSCERLQHLVVELHREVQVRPAAVAAGRCPAELLAGDDALPIAHHHASSQVPVHRVHMPPEAGDDHVVVDRGHGSLEVLVREVVGDLDHDPVQRGEHRDADALLPEGADDRVLAGVAVVGLVAAVPVERCRPGVEVDEVGDVQVLPEDPGLRIEGEDGWLGRGRLARRGEGRAPEDEEEQSRERRPCNGLTIIRSLRREQDRALVDFINDGVVETSRGLTRAERREARRAPRVAGAADRHGRRRPAALPARTRRAERRFAPPARARAPAGGAGRRLRRRLRPGRGEVDRPDERVLAGSFGSILRRSRPPRLKRCADETCRRAFVDETRSHTRRWCDRERAGTGRVSVVIGVG